MIYLRLVEKSTVIIDFLTNLSLIFKESHFIALDGNGKCQL